MEREKGEFELAGRELLAYVEQDEKKASEQYERRYKLIEARINSEIEKQKQDTRYYEEELRQS